MPIARVRATRSAAGGAKKSAAPTAATATKSGARKTVARNASAATTKARATAPSALIDARIAELADWRGAMLARLRELIREADPDVVEEWKWRGVPVWEDHGIVCTGETYKSVVKMTFAKGASLPDPARLFNSSLDGNVRRAIDLREGDAVDGQALKALVSAAVALNRSSRAR
jgi:hypothetical protein